MSEETQQNGLIKLDLTELSTEPNSKKWIRFFEKPIKILSKIIIFERYLNDIDQDHSALTFWGKWLKHLQIFCKLLDGSLKEISITNTLIFVANHPSGLIDCIAVTAMIKEIRPDAKILRNPFLQVLTGLTDDFVENIETIKPGAALIIFPSVWDAAIGKLILNSTASVIPIFSHQRDHYLYHSNSWIAPFLSIRECLKQRGNTLYYSIGREITAENLHGLSAEEVSDYIHKKVYQLKF